MKFYFLQILLIMSLQAVTLASCSKNGDDEGTEPSGIDSNVNSPFKKAARRTKVAVPSDLPPTQESEETNQNINLGTAENDNSLADDNQEPSASPPEWIAATDNISLAVGASLSLNFIATDNTPGDTPSYWLNNDQMTCDDGSWSRLPQINTNTGELTGTPNAQDIGTCTIIVVATSGPDTITKNVSVTITPTDQPVTAISFLAPNTILSGICMPITLQANDANGYPALLDIVENNIALNVNNGMGLYFTNDSCTSETNITDISAGEYATIIYFKSDTAPQQLTLIAASTNYENGSININVGSAATSLIQETSPQILKDACEKFVISRVDASGNKVPEAVKVDVNLSQNGTLKFFTNAACTEETNSTAIAAGQSAKNIWIKSNSIATVDISATDASTVLISSDISVDIVADFDWWNNDWSKRIRIQISNLDQNEGFTNQVVLVQLNSGRVNYSDILSDGVDLRFIADNHTTQLAHEIDSWNPSGTSYIWVTVPTITASSAKNYIYLYYQNPNATDDQDRNAVWDKFYSVWHLGEWPNDPAPQYADSTATGNHASAENDPTTIAAKFGNGLDLAGDNDTVDVGTDLSATLGYSSTFSAWLKTTQVGDDTMWRAPGITGVEGAGNANDIFFGWIDASGYLGVTAGNGAAAKSNFIVNDNIWRHITITRNHLTGSVQFFVNGVLNGSGTSEAGAKTLPFSKLGIIGDTGGTPEELDASLEEVRIYASVQNAAQIKADYKFMLDTYLSYSATESK